MNAVLTVPTASKLQCCAWKFTLQCKCVGLCVVIADLKANDDKAAES